MNLELSIHRGGEDCAVGMTSTDNSNSLMISSNDVGHHSEDLDPLIPSHGAADKRVEITEEEVKGILDVIAATGKFWHNWDTLKSLLSFRLKQVKRTQSWLQALLSFIEGPPFTLQRVCEILLTARSIYPNLSKLALALEKNLLATSTLAISTDPYPSTVISKPDDELDKGGAGLVAHLSPVQNGIDSVVVGDEDEEMADTEDAHEEDSKSHDNETAEEMINSGALETGSEQSTSANPSAGSSPPSSEPHNSTSY